MIFKIDMDKAYDHVEWCFVDYMLGQLGFSSKWRAWIWEGISSTSFSTLINGSPCRLFKASSGLRQGDPLSPFLFTIVVKALSALFCMAKEIGLIEGCDVGGGEKALTHLQFMDDTILFSSAQCKEVIVLKRILICFGPALGLKVNLSNSVGGTMVCGRGGSSVTQHASLHNEEIVIGVSWVAYQGYLRDQRRFGTLFWKILSTCCPCGKRTIFPSEEG